MGSDRPKLTNCKPEDFSTLFRKLGGFVLYEGKRHIKATHQKTGLITTVPRHPRVNKHIARAIIEDYLIRDLGFTEKEIYKIFWC